MQSLPGFVHDARVVRLVPPDERWPKEFERITAELGDAVGGDARRIDHIGSTSVPGLASKDVIDVQITVADEDALRRATSALAERGWRWEPDYRDHQVPGAPTDASEWVKSFLGEPDGRRRTHVHVRIEGRANQRYALLFRDYLRTHPDAAAAYEDVKRGLAVLAPDADTYADAKDSTCDLIYLAAEIWASGNGWSP